MPILLVHAANYEPSIVSSGQVVKHGRQARTQQPLQEGGGSRIHIPLIARAISNRGDMNTLLLVLLVRSLGHNCGRHSAFPVLDRRMWREVHGWHAQHGRESVQPAEIQSPWQCWMGPRRCKGGPRRWLHARTCNKHATGYQRGGLIDWLID